MLEIFNAKKKNYNLENKIPKKGNDVGITKHYPPANKE
jgi:hypothetical protein